MNRNSRSNYIHGHRHAADSAARERLRPKRELLIFLGWLRLLQAITTTETRNG